jgi:hypothetical protein
MRRADGQCPERGRWASPSRARALQPRPLRHGGHVLRRVLRLAAKEAAQGRVNSVANSDSRSLGPSTRGFFVPRISRILCARLKQQTASRTSPRSCGLDFDLDGHGVHQRGHRVQHRNLEPGSHGVGLLGVGLDDDANTGKALGACSRRSHNRARASFKPSAPVPWIGRFSRWGSGVLSSSR